MSIVQFLRILWARRWITVVGTLGCLVGAIIVVLVVPPRWEAHSRIMLDNIKADPLTGLPMGIDARDYAETQVELIKDYPVALATVQQLGWLSDPTIIAAYDHNSKKGGVDFRHWAAQFVIDRTDAEQVPDTNILEITYTAASPAEAKAVADALTKAYLDTSAEFRRETAGREADWFDGQVRKAKAELDAGSDAEASYQRQTGIVLQDDKTDVDSARLRALASAAGAAPVFAPITTTGSAASAELAQVNAAIAQASQTLGPNHPELGALKSKRAALSAEVAQEEAAARAASVAASSGVGAVDRAMASAKSRVLAQTTELEHLRELHANVQVLRDQYNKTAARAADLRQEAMVGDAGITVLGPATTPQHPKFPNQPLVVGGSLGLGLAFGGLIGLLIELLGRRVRGAEDLTSIGVPLLAVIPRSREVRAAAFPRPRPRTFRIRAPRANVARA